MIHLVVDTDCSEVSARRQGERRSMRSCPARQESKLAKTGYVITVHLAS
jgi:hypothetical protein